MHGQLARMAHRRVLHLLALGMWRRGERFGGHHLEDSARRRKQRRGQLAAVLRHHGNGAVAFHLGSGVHEPPGLDGRVCFDLVLHDHIVTGEHDAAPDGGGTAGVGGA